MSEPQEQHSIRLWPLCIIAAAVVIALLAIWLPESLNRQMQVVPTIGVFILAGLFSLLWLLLLSRLAWGQRMRYFGAVVLAIVLSFLMSEDCRGSLPEPGSRFAVRTTCLKALSFPSCRTRQAAVRPVCSSPVSR